MASSRLLVVLTGTSLLVAAGAWMWGGDVAEQPPAPRHKPLRAPEDLKELVVLVRPGPVVYFPGPDGNMIGLEADLLRRFGLERALPVRFVTSESPLQLLDRLSAGDAHIGIGGLFVPPERERRTLAIPNAEADSGSDATIDVASSVLWTSGWRTDDLQVLSNAEGYKARGWSDLNGATVSYVAGTGLESDIARIRAAYPLVLFRALDAVSTMGLAGQISEGAIDYAVAGTLATTVARSIFVDVAVAFPLGASRELGWAVAPQFPDLRKSLDDYIARAKRDGTLARLVARYLPDGSQFQRIDASALHADIGNELPNWRALFHDAQERTGVEWRLLAAIAYQESKWDPAAQSETGARGLMQITEETAKHLGIADRADPRTNLLGAARYLRDLKSKLPARIEEPDRTWLALAAFNIGMAHLEDARILAQKQRLSPDLWNDVRQVLPLLAQPEYYNDAKYGYARGGMPVAFVDRVRGYYDILLARQPPLTPRLRASSP